MSESKHSDVTSSPPLAVERDYYFDSYSHYGIHESMLKDTVRTLSYRDSLYQNMHVVRDKVVLDVGCGTCILSMFAARCGARKVYAVDCSSIVNQAREIVQENNLQDIIVVIQGKLEEVTLPEKVDVIISEWMGYFLIYESMLNSVLFARDKFAVSPTQCTMFPNRARIFLAGMNDARVWKSKAKSWSNIRGLDFSCVSRYCLLEPSIDIVPPKQICTSTATLVNWDLEKINVDDLSFTQPFELKATRADTLHAIASWFDTLFDLHECVNLSTTPHSTSTHWKQTIFYLVTPLNVRRGDVVKGKMRVGPNPGNHRDLDIRIEIEFKGAVQSGTVVQDYRLR